MTFLSFVLDRFFDRQGNYWHCPWCERTNASIVANEPREGHKDKWRCVACRKWGDEYDLLRLVLPNEKFPRLRTCADLLRAQYEAGETGSAPTAVLASPPSSPRGRGTDRDWTATAERFAAGLGPCQRRELADALGVPVGAFDHFPLFGFDPEGRRWAFPECDGSGRITTVFFRSPVDPKNRGAWLGGRRGLTLPTGWRDRSDPVLVTEGASDAVAATAAGLRAVGRASAGTGSELLAELFTDLTADAAVIVLGDNDEPGRAGAEQIAGHLGAALRCRVSWALPPEGFKDVRAFLTSPDRGGVEWADRGAELLEHFVKSRR